MRDRRNDLNRSYGQKVIIILRSKDLIVNKKLKPPTKTARWSNLNGFDGWMAKDTRFWSSIAKTKRGQSWMVKNRLFPKKVILKFVQNHNSSFF